MFNTPPAINRALYQSSGQKLAIFVGIFVLSIVALLSGIAAVGAFIYLFGIQKADHDLTANLIAIPVCAGCVFGLTRLVPAFRRPVDFAPRFAVPPAAWGHPFDVRLQRKTAGTAFTGKGVVQFFPDHMIIDGVRETPIYVQLGILVAITVVPLVAWGFALGFIPAALLATLVGRKKLVQAIPYQAIRGVKVRGNIVTLEVPGLSPGKSWFYVAAVDGARLHGEIQPRFGAMLQG